MSAFLDDLARSMATAVTRRDAARMLAGAVIGLALPGSRALARGQNSPCKTGSFECQCPNPYRLFYRLCCPEADRRCQCITLAAVCVPDPCPGPTCGAHHCCLADEECVSPNSGTCCKRGDSACTVTPEFSTDPVPRGRCCSSTQTCVSNRKFSNCCKAGQILNATGDCVNKLPF